MSNVTTNEPENLQEKLRRHKLTWKASKIGSLPIVKSERRAQVYANALLKARRRNKFLKFKPTLSTIPEVNEDELQD